MIGQSTVDPSEEKAAPASDSQGPALAPQPPPTEEHGGRDGPDPTRYGDWEKNGRCIDF
ncbi:DUF1674 domain-containing protein [Novilysobacter spongiicola]|uniref:DUF1674 domain-containing protein n=1 Tax=Novilysobacter spongiicola TaxID=435289 RepID=UPI0009997744|nr:succinate dehydrogenase assembly factor 4 [Lysobacter spongiicola]